MRLGARSRHKTTSPDVLEKGAFQQAQNDPIERPRVTVLALLSSNPERPKPKLWL